MNAYEAYLYQVMRGLANSLYNVSQNPSVENCNALLDSIKRQVQEYEQVSGKNLNVKDWRER